MTNRRHIEALLPLVDMLVDASMIVGGLIALDQPAQQAHDAMNRARAELVSGISAAVAEGIEHKRNYRTWRQELSAKYPAARFVRMRCGICNKYRTCTANDVPVVGDGWTQLVGVCYDCWHKTD